MSTKQFNCILFLVVVYFLLTTCMNEEYFSNKEDRASDIVQWFKGNPKSSIKYSRYQKEVEDSDTLEYAEAKRLFRKGNLTEESLLSKL